MEKITLVDIDDNIIGYETKEEVHKKGLLHRAFSVFIVNDGKMLLQRRNINKYHSGGLWTNACCSHQREGEELYAAVHRRLFEELSFDCELSEEFSFIYRTAFSNGLFEYEVDHVFLGEYSGEVKLNPEEADEMCWVRFEDLKKDLQI
nr:isopentenyl-diphosphate Delta-isomerase [Eubacterium sp.]